MKKVLVITVIVLTLAISATAITIANSDTNSNANTTSAITTDDKVSTTPTGELIEKFKQNKYFNSQNFEFKEMLDAVKLDKSTAIQKSKDFVGEANSQEAKKISAMLVKYTNKEINKLPDSDILLQDYPVWVVSFEGVYAKKHSGKGSGGNSMILADSHVFVDANSGEILQRISHTSLDK